MTRMCLNRIHFTSFILCIHLSRISKSSHYCLFFTYAIFCPVQIAVLITNGQSDDQVNAAVRAVADNGITVFAVGECGSCYCEFFQHPHCSSPSDFIQALPAYLQCLQLEIHVLYIWIHWIRCGYLCVGVLFLSIWARSCFCMYTQVCVCKDNWSIQLLCFVCKGTLSDSVASSFSLLMNAHYRLPPSLLAHTVPCPFPPTHRHKHTSPQLTPHSLQRCNNYCSLANGVLIAVIFH